MGTDFGKPCYETPELLLTIETANKKVLPFNQVVYRSNRSKITCSFRLERCIEKFIRPKVKQQLK